MSRNRSNNHNGESRLTSVASWAVLTASFGLSASTWIALGTLAGFTDHLTIGTFTLRLAWLMPFVVDGYVVVALTLWMAPVPARVAKFAMWNTYLAAGIGVVAQSAYHALITWTDTQVAWRTVMAAVVGALVPAVAGAAVHMRALNHRESETTTTASSRTTDISTPMVVPAPAVLAPAVPTITPTVPASLVDTAPVVPATTPDPVPEPVLVPTLAALADRITERPTVPGPAPRKPAPRPSPPRPSTPATPAGRLAPSATDIHVTPADAAQLALPIVSPALLARAKDVIAQHQAESDSPITKGQLAARLQVSTALAREVQIALDNQPNTDTPAVNGYARTATR
jgi:hypothetical protein